MTNYEQLKLFDPAVSGGSVMDTPKADEVGGIHPLVLSLAVMADEIPAWGNVVSRDKALRDFWPTEPTLASAIYNIATRMALMEWHIEGSDPTKPKPRNTARAAEIMLRNADRGNGWEVFMLKLVTDLMTQDNGGFIEVIRRGPKPTDPVVNIAHLDSARCQRTGDPQYPVVYTDRQGRKHKMGWWQVLTIEDMPSPIETMYGVQYSALTRALRAAQIIRDITIYKKEKVSGNFARAVHLVSGLTKQNLEDALALARESQMNQHLFRYQNPAIIPTIDPDANLKVETIELASLPDHFNEDTTFKWYISQLALAFGVDYQEFAPLPGGQLGSSGQAEILHLKSRGKGPAALINRIEFLINYSGILPNSVKFGFREMDTRANTAMAEARYLRGRDRALRIDSGELSQEAAIQQAVLDGDLPEHLAEELLSNPPERQRQPDPLGAGQITGGQDTQQQPDSAPTDSGATEDKEVTDKKRVALIRRLGKNGDLILPDESLMGEITPEDIAAEKKYLGVL